MAKNFAVLSYDTENIGDEIQSIAAMQFLPKIDRYLNREWLNKELSSTSEILTLIMNGWYCHLPENWPPSDNIRPLLISMHLTAQKSESGFVPYQHLLQGRNRNYFLKHGPVGTRDLQTLRYFEAARVPSYFSGCLTLTLQRPDVPREEKLIILNDVPEDVEESIRHKSYMNIQRVSQITIERDLQKRFNAASGLLDQYAKASLVITSRLHCALPCVAFGTPVIFITSASDKTRFAGLDKLMTCYSASEFCAFARRSRELIPPVSLAHVNLRDNLVRAVTDFVQDDTNRTDAPRYLIQNPIAHDPTTGTNYGSVIRACYLQILGREPDSDGFLHYSNIIRSRDLESGIEFMIRDILESHESKWQKKYRMD